MVVFIHRSLLKASGRKSDRRQKNGRRRMTLEAYKQRKDHIFYVCWHLSKRYKKAMHAF